MKKLMWLVIMLTIVAGTYGNAVAGADKTDYPVIFAHGIMGFDDILGMNYFGNDYGTFVGDPCDKFLEMNCNWDIDKKQLAYAAQVHAFQSSDARGLELAEAIENYMIRKKVSHVSIIGHSQGGNDARKAARILYEQKGYTVVKVLMSVSSPHRGAPIAKALLDTYPDLRDLIEVLAKIYGSVIYEPGNDAVAAFKSLMYNDYDPHDGVVTGLKDYNERNPVDSRYASQYVSFMTAQNGLNLNPALQPFKAFTTPDADGYCIDDCDDDGAAGCGDGNPGNRDDDGMVGINSQQMGYRMAWVNVPFLFDYVYVNYDMGYVSDINYPNSSQMTSLTSVLNQDHVDVIGLGPDTFDEMEFYAAAIDYIASVD